MTVGAQQTTSVGGTSYLTEDILKEMRRREPSYLKMVAEKGHSDEELKKIGLLISEAESEIGKGAKITNDYKVKSMKEDKYNEFVADFIGRLIDLIEPTYSRTPLYTNSGKSDNSAVAKATYFSGTKADYPSDPKAEYQSFIPNWSPLQDSYMNHVHSKACDSPNSKCPDRIIKQIR